VRLGGGRIRNKVAGWKGCTGDSRSDLLSGECGTEREKAVVEKEARNGNEGIQRGFTA
jgi:hypothetical protein